MKQLLNRPLLLGFLLSLPLWVVLGNFVVALIAALLFSFLISMYVALRTLQRRDSANGVGSPKEAGRDDGTNHYHAGQSARAHESEEPDVPHQAATEEKSE